MSYLFAGLSTILVPMYVSEIAPLNLRGALGTVNQLAVTIGLCVSQILGVDQLLGTNDGWPVLLGELKEFFLSPFSSETNRRRKKTRKGRFPLLFFILLSFTSIGPSGSIRIL